MELFDEEELSKKGNNKNKKMVINLIVIMSAILIVLIALMLIMPAQKNVYKETFKINDSLIDSSLIINVGKEKVKKYISIKDIDNLMNYTYYKNEEKLYINNNYEVITFEIDSKEITKKAIDSIVDAQKYELKNDIIEKEDKEYVSLEDLRSFYKCYLFI